MIMISGWLENNEDYKRAFGVLPEYMSFKERLTRFYQNHCPDRYCIDPENDGNAANMMLGTICCRLGEVEEELEDFEDRPDQLFDQVMLRLAA
jgi:hypothetical protein